MNYAVLFSGQGTQHAQMLPWLESTPDARPGLDALSSALGEAWRTRLHDAGWATRNRHAQPLIVGVSLAAWQALAAHLPPPAVVAGYSVGELSALACAGVIDMADAVSLACLRAKAMDDAVTRDETGLIAVNAAPHLDLDALLARLDVPGIARAIDVARGRIVLGGPVASLDAATVRLEAAGVRVTRLCVAVASHTRWLDAARAPLRAALESVPTRDARMRMVSSTTAVASRDRATLLDAFVEQVASTVRWRDTMTTVFERSPTCVLEVGPGHSLSGMWPHADAVPIRALEDFHGPADAAAWVARHAGAH